MNQSSGRRLELSLSIEEEVRRAFSRFGFSTLYYWSSISGWLSSPIFKVVGSLPIVGYLVLYSEAFDNWFELIGIGEDLFLSGPIRLRMLYYGGVLMLLALGLNQVLSPKVTRRFRSDDDFVEHVARNPRPTWLIEAIRDLWRLDYFRSHSVFKGFQPEREAELQVFSQRLHEVFHQSGRPDLALPKAIESRSFARLAEDELQSGIIESLDRWGEVSNRYQVQQACESLFRQQYACLNAYFRVKIRFLTAALAICGLILVAIPAIDTFLRVVLIDFSGRGAG